MDRPLKYRIQNWHQLSNCQSNNSRDLRIEVSDYIQNPRLQGTKIAIKDNQLGTIFCCVLNAQGPLTTDPTDSEVYEFTPSQILSELRKYGFDVEYYPGSELDGPQMQYLMTIDSLGMDKIRVVHVSHRDKLTGERAYTKHIVCFNSSFNPMWLTNTFTPTEAQFTEALNNGSAINITNVSYTNKFDWSWLQGFVGDIKDILQSNAEVMSQCP